MRDEDRWPTLDRDTGSGPGTPPAERTEQMPAVPDHTRQFDQPTVDLGGRAGERDTERTQRIPAVPPGGPRTERRPLPGQQESRDRRKPLLIGAAVVGLLAVLYGGDLVLSSGSVPRGVTVAGVPIGGLSEQEAESTLRDSLSDRLTRPVTLQAGDARTQLDPRSAGIDLDVPGTIDRAGDQPLNPITRLTSLFTSREVGTVSTVDRQLLSRAITERREELNAEAREGTVGFAPVPGEDGAVTAKAVMPRAGSQLDVRATVDATARDWLTRSPVPAVVNRQPVRTTPEGVREALEKIATPAVSGPVQIRGNGAEATLQPVDIARSLSFVPAERGGLIMRIDQPKLVAAAEPQLAKTERKGRNAAIVFTSGSPEVRPGTAGRAVSWKKTLEPMRRVLAMSGAERRLDARYTKKPPEVTTKEAGALGIKEVIGEFRTSGFATDSGQNIRQVAEEVNGAIVKPGKTFSLNDFTGQRTEAEGYVPAGIIEDGVPSRAVGGGISQFATTLYNASYFAGLRDAGHQEHSYYISRYPAAREATVYLADDGEIDLAFTNDAPTGVAIQTIWTPTDITVRLWGTKRYRAESITGERTNVVPPGTERGKPGICEPSEGVAGFTITDTRVLYDIRSGAEASRNTRKVTYNPEPKIVCR